MRDLSCRAAAAALPPPACCPGCSCRCSCSAGARLWLRRRRCLGASQMPASVSESAAVAGSLRERWRFLGCCLLRCWPGCCPGCCSVPPDGLAPLARTSMAASRAAGLADRLRGLRCCWIPVAFFCPCAAWAGSPVTSGAWAAPKPTWLLGEFMPGCLGDPSFSFSLWDAAGPACCLVAAPGDRGASWSSLVLLWLLRGTLTRMLVAQGRRTGARMVRSADITRPRAWYLLDHTHYELEL